MPGPFRFVPPVLPAGAQTRPRLLRTLLGRFTHRCTVVVAGAGHGKTTLLVQAVAENRLAPRGDDVWLTLESTDADATLLAGDLLTALGAEGTDPTAAAVADAVWRRAPTEVCLVLDDVHEVPAGSAGSELRRVAGGRPPRQRPPRPRRADPAGAPPGAPRRTWRSAPARRGGAALRRRRAHHLRHRAGGRAGHARPRRGVAGDGRAPRHRGSRPGRGVPVAGGARAARTRAAAGPRRAVRPRRR